MTLKLPNVKVNTPSKLVIIAALAVVAIAIYDDTLEINLCE